MTLLTARWLWCSVSANLIIDTQGSHHLIMGTLTTNIHQPDLFSDRPSLASIHTLRINNAVAFLDSVCLSPVKVHSFLDSVLFLFTINIVFARFLV